MGSVPLSLPPPPQGGVLAFQRRRRPKPKRRLECLGMPRDFFYSAHRVSSLCVLLLKSQGSRLTTTFKRVRARNGAWRRVCFRVPPLLWRHPPHLHVIVSPCRQRRTSLLSAAPAAATAATAAFPSAVFVFSVPTALGAAARSAPTAAPTGSRRAFRLRVSTAANPAPAPAPAPAAAAAARASVPTTRRLGDVLSLDKPLVRFLVTAVDRSGEG